MRFIERIKNLWKLSAAELTVNYAQEVKLKAPSLPITEPKKLVQIIKLNQPEDDNLPE